MVCIEAR